MADNFDRRQLLQVTAAGIAMVPFAVRQAAAQVPDSAEIEKILYPAPGLPGGGQMEVRMTVEADNPDPDIVEIARRLEPYNPESWHAEHKRMAEKNEAMAGKFEADGHKVTAGEYFLRAANFWRSAVLYLAAADERMLPTYAKLQQNFDKAWSLLPPPFEKVDIPYEGGTLRGHFYPARAPAGQKAPVVFNYGGADGLLLSGSADGGSGQFRARGMSFFDVDGPGQGGTVRLEKIYATPDSERYGKAVVDYLLTRSDVDGNRIAFHGSSMGGYCAPRCATADPRIKAVAVWSGAFALQQDIFDYYPPIRERLRWLMGAEDFTDARAKMADFTLDGRADKIECPLLVGYSIDDRVMDPRGALRLYNSATKAANRSMIEGTGHARRKFAVRTYLADWLAKQLATGA